MPAYGEPRLGWTEYLTGKKHWAESKFELRNSQIVEIRRRRFNDPRPEAEPPAAFAKTTKRFQSPLVRDTVRRTKSIMAAQLPVPKRIPLNAKPSQQHATTKIEKFLKAAYRRLRRSGDVYGQINDAYAEDGQTVWKCILRLQRFSNIERKKGEAADDYNERAQEHRRQHFPFYWEHIDTTTFYPLAYDEDGLCEAMEICEREALEVAEQYDLIFTRDGLRKRELGDVVDTLTGRSSVHKTCKWVEYWNRDHFVYMADGEIVKTEEHENGAPPYYHSLFAPTSLKDPAMMTESIVDPLIPIQDAMESMVSIHMNWAYLTGFPFLTLEPIGEDQIPPYEGDDKLTWAPGEMMTPPLGYRIVWRGAPPAGSDLSTLRDLFQSQADQYSLAPILYGKVEGDISGPVALSAISIAKALFGPGTANLAYEFDRMASWMLRMIDEVIKLPVSIWDDGDGKWIDLGPDDIQGYYDVQHELEPIIPMERQQRAALWADAQARGAVDMNHYREEGLGLSAPEEMETRVLIEQGLNRPEVWAIVLEMLQQKLQLMQPKPEPPMLMPVPGGGQAPPPGVPVGPPMTTQVAGVQQAMMPGVSPEMAAMNPPSTPMGQPVGM